MIFQIEDAQELKQLDKLVFVELVCTGNPFTRHPNYMAEIKHMFSALRTIVSLLDNFKCSKISSLQH